MFIPEYEEIQVDYAEGTTQYVRLHDGPTIKLSKLSRDYDPTSKWKALELIEQSRANHEFVTGLLYIDQNRATLPDVLHLSDTPLAALSEPQLRPSRERFDAVMAELA